ncbi:MAG: ubiquinol-cytochrome C chaperone family protein [Pseudomonadota bacterium]
MNFKMLEFFKTPFTIFKTYKATRHQAANLYRKAVLIVTEQRFYQRFELDDQFETRLDVLALYLFFLLEGIERSSNTGSSRFKIKKMQRLILECAVADIEDSLRREGVSDIRIGKQVQKTSQSFFGRLGAYRLAMKTKDDLKETFGATISKNLYRHKNKKNALTKAFIF